MDSSSTSLLPGNLGLCMWLKAGCIFWGSCHWDFPPLDGHVEQQNWKNGPFSPCNCFFDPIFRLHVGYTSLLRPEAEGLLSWASYDKTGTEPAGPPFGEEDLYLRQLAQPGPLLSPPGKKGGVSSSLSAPYHTQCDSHSLTPTLTRPQPAADDAPQPMRFTPRSEPSASCVFFNYHFLLRGNYRGLIVGLCAQAARGITSAITEGVPARRRRGGGGGGGEEEGWEYPNWRSDINKKTSAAESDRDRQLSKSWCVVRCLCPCAPLDERLWAICPAGAKFKLPPGRHPLKWDMRDDRAGQMDGGEADYWPCVH